MGRIEKQVSEGTTKYYWYPGDKREWKRAAVSVGIGLGAFLVVYVMTRDLLPAVVGGTSVTAGVSGLNFGRRDARAHHHLPQSHRACRAPRRRRADRPGRLARSRARVRRRGGGGADPQPPAHRCHR